MKPIFPGQDAGTDGKTDGLGKDKVDGQTPSESDKGQKDGDEGIKTHCNGQNSQKLFPADCSFGFHHVDDPVPSPPDFSIEISFFSRLHHKNQK